MCDKLDKGEHAFRFYPQNMSDNEEDSLLQEHEDERETDNINPTTSHGLGDPWTAILEMQKSINTMAKSVTDLKNGQPAPSSSTAQLKKPSKRKSAEVNNNAPHSKKQKSSTGGHESIEIDAEDSDSDVNELMSSDKGAEDDDLLEEIEKELDTTDKTGPDVHKNLANIVNKRFSAKLEDSKLKEKLELYSRPGNCDKLKAPEVNPEVWGKLKTSQKSCDLRMVNVQKTIIKATVAMTEVANELFEKKYKSDAIRKLTDGIALLGHATYELSLRRRDIMRPSINKDLQALCNQQTPVTDLLFGNDIQNSLKTIKECNKIANTATAGRDRPEYHSRRNNYGYKPFLSNRKDQKYHNFKKKWWQNKGKKESSQ